MMVETQPNPMVEKREYRMHHDVPVLLAQPCSELPGNLHSHRRSRTDGKRKVKAAGMPHSKSPSLFDHRVRNPSTIESNYQFHLTVNTLAVQLMVPTIRPIADFHRR